MDAKNNYGNTPLHLACATSRVDIVRLLLDYGADVTVRNEQRTTPLEVAFRLVARDTRGQALHDLFREHHPESTFQAVLNLPAEDPMREEQLDWYREHHPDLVMEAWCATGR